MKTHCVTPNIPYAATDHDILITQAHAHLIDADLCNFAIMSVPQTMHMFWAVERERTFARLMKRDRLPLRIFRASNSVDTESETELIAWVKSLPMPIGVIAVHDGRGRQLLQACELADIEAPKEVAAINIDNDVLGRKLSKVPLSSMI